MVELEKHLNVSRRHIHRQLSSLAKHNLVERFAKGCWRRQMPSLADLDKSASELGVSGAGRRQRQRHRSERESYRLIARQHLTRQNASRWLGRSHEEGPARMDASSSDMKGTTIPVRSRPRVIRVDHWLAPSRGSYLLARAGDNRRWSYTPGEPLGPLRWPRPPAAACWRVPGGLGGYAPRADVARVVPLGGIRFPWETLKSFCSLNTAVSDGLLKPAGAVHT